MLLFDDSKKLEKALGEEAASVIAHVFEKADDSWRRDLATKADLMEVRVEMQAMRNDLLERIGDVRVEVQAMKNELIKWMIGGFIALGAFLVAAMTFLR
jgi:hypothetical protein